MNEHENIDGLLKKKLENRSFEFQDSYWEAAEQLIDADSNARKKRRWFFLLLFFFLASGLGGIVSWFQFAGSQPGYANALTNGNSMPDSMNNRTKVPPSSPEVHNQILIVEEVCDESASSSSVPKKRFSAVFRSSNKPGTKRNKDVINNRNPMSEEARAPLPTETPGETPPGRFRSSDVRDIAFEGYLPSRNFSLYNELKRPGVLPKQSLSFRKRHALGIMLGTTLAPGLQNNSDTRAAISTHPSVGLRYSYSLGKGIRLQTGLLYQGRGGLNADSTYRSVNFSFGAETEATTISPQSLHYVEVPLMADVHLAGRHYLMGGVNLAYLINTRSDVHKEKILPFETVDMGSNKAWGYRQGFQPLDASVTVGYGYYLNRGLRLGVRANYGLRDITDDSFFLNNTRDRNLQLRLVLEYDLFHF